MSVRFYKWVSFEGFFRGFLGLFCVSSFFSSDFGFFGVSGAAAGENETYTRTWFCTGRSRVWVPVGFCKWVCFVGFSVGFRVSFGFRIFFPDFRVFWILRFFFRFQVHPWIKNETGTWIRFYTDQIQIRVTSAKIHSKSHLSSAKPAIDPKPKSKLPSLSASLGVRPSSNKVLFVSSSGRWWMPIRWQGKTSSSWVKSKSKVCGDACLVLSCGHGVAGMHVRFFHLRSYLVLARTSVISVVRA
jgi:hypothetical protein